MAEIKLYIDTSALLKCYVAEKNSDKVENFLASRFDGTKSCLVLSSLSTLEWHCAMRRRERAGDFDASYRLIATAAFQDRIAAGYYEMLRLENALYGKALALLEKIDSPLRSLDAMHLAIAHSAGIAELVTADKVMAGAAKELGLKTHFFA
jgi:uncharacterized protein